MKFRFEFQWEEFSKLSYFSGFIVKNNQIHEMFIDKMARRLSCEDGAMGQKANAGSYVLSTFSCLVSLSQVTAVAPATTMDSMFLIEDGSDSKWEDDQFILYLQERAGMVLIVNKYVEKHIGQLQQIWLQAYITQLICCYTALVIRNRAIHSCSCLETKISTNFILWDLWGVCLEHSFQGK